MACQTLAPALAPNPHRCLIGYPAQPPLQIRLRTPLASGETPHRESLFTKIAAYDYQSRALISWNMCPYLLRVDPCVITSWSRGDLITGSGRYHTMVKHSTLAICVLKSALKCVGSRRPACLGKKPSIERGAFNIIKDKRGASMAHFIELPPVSS